MVHQAKDEQNEEDDEMMERRKIFSERLFPIFHLNRNVTGAEGEREGAAESMGMMKEADSSSINHPSKRPFFFCIFCLNTFT